jgi:hypothetical protein
VNLIILGMHRSGTSCLASLLMAAGARVSGTSLRNWDNPRGHHEASDLVRLNEDVLAHSGGHWLKPPPTVRWTAAQAAERDRLLATPEQPALWKDPRTLLVLPFWQAASAPRRFIGIVRHPLAVAHSLLAWRGMPVDDALHLWRAHVAALATSGAPIVCFDQPKAQFIQEVARLALDLGLHPDGLEAAYAEDGVHHSPEGPTGDGALLADCLAIYAQVAQKPVLDQRVAPGAFPWAQVEATCAALAAGLPALALAQAALAAAADPAGALAPIAVACLKHHPDTLLALLDTHPLPPALAHLLRGKAHLAAQRPAEAAIALHAACAVEAPLYEARHLLPVALWEAGGAAAADTALAELLPSALYPFRLHARRAEWAWQAGDAEAALAHLEAALHSAPPWRHGRLLHRRAAWRQARGDHAGAAEDRRLAAERDPGFRRGGAAATTHLPGARSAPGVPKE